MTTALITALAVFAAGLTFVMLAAWVRVQQRRGELRRLEERRLERQRRHAERVHAANRERYEAGR